MAETKTKTNVSNFDTIYDATEAGRKAARKPISKERTEGKLKSAHRDARDKILDAQDRLETLRSKIENLDINAIIEERETIKTLQNYQTDIEAEYLFMFGEEM